MGGGVVTLPTCVRGGGLPSYFIVEFTYLNRVRGLHTGATTHAEVAHCGYYGNKLTDCLIYFLIALWILDELVGCMIWFCIICHDPTSVDPDFLIHDRWGGPEEESE